MSAASLSTPVALLLFNRPAQTARVFAEIAKARPRQLLIVADGPRAEHPEDVEKCAAVRELATRVDWPCEVRTNFSDVNLGVKMRPATGLDWVFSLVEEAIILEDDCLPHPSFFPYCEELLAQYRDDERVMLISGNNFLGEWKTNFQSYHFAFLAGTWGWASWRRAWRFYDRDLALWPHVCEHQILENLFPNPEHSAFWTSVFARLQRGEIITWDFQWLLARWLQHGLGIVPSVNLVLNIGFDENATTTKRSPKWANLPVGEMKFPLQHPRTFVRDRPLDDAVMERCFCPPPKPQPDQKIPQAAGKAGPSLPRKKKTTFLASWPLVGGFFRGPAAPSSPPEP